MTKPVKTKDEIIAKFIEFNKEAQEIFDLSFKDKLNGSGVTIKWNALDKLLRTELRGPDDESIKAFCNDLRKFIQKNDSLKVEKLNLFYQSTIVCDKERKMFGKEMSDIDKFLKVSTNYSINIKNYTNREILEIFLYGKFSHRTEGQKEIHDSIEKTSLYLSLKNEFIVVLQRYFILINNLVYINNEVIKSFK
ncbi:MAG: hypothetical protein AABX23_04560 [Nanoarchaeota archaeon]